MALGFHASEVNLNCEKERNVGEGEKERENRGYLTWMETESCLQQFQHPSDRLQLWFQRYDSSTSSQLSHWLRVRDCEVYSATLSFECCSKKAGRSVKKVIFLYVCACVYLTLWWSLNMRVQILSKVRWKKRMSLYSWLCTGMVDLKLATRTWLQNSKEFEARHYCTHIAANYRKRCGFRYGFCAQSFSKCMTSLYLNLYLLFLSVTELPE